MWIAMWIMQTTKNEDMELKTSTADPGSLYLFV